MHRSISRLFFIMATALAIVGSLANSTFNSCGNCDPGWYWPGVSDGAYRFDSNVPEYVKQATYWADDGWGVHYPDQGNQSGTLITVGSLPSGVTGEYDAGTNTLTIAEATLNHCPDPGCNVLESVIAHELGHTLGFDNIEAGCESSIMSWARDRSLVIGPSSEDMCWLSNGYDGWEGDGSGCTECEDRQAVPLQVDYDSPPTSWREGLDRAELVAVIRLKSRSYEEDSRRTPFTRFDADIIEVIKDSRGAYHGGGISVTRFGGVREFGGVVKMVEEAHFAPWTEGQTLLVFLNWFDRDQSYTAFGPHAAFELDANTNRARAFARSRFGGSHDGKAVGSLLAEVKAAR